MKLVEQVVSLELAKKLKKLGVKQESLWYWVKLQLQGWIINKGYGRHKEYYSAFTVAELGEMLPQWVKVGNRSHKFDYRGKNSYDQWVFAYHIDYQSPLKTVFDKTEANARAKMLIYLKEKGLIK